MNQKKIGKRIQEYRKDRKMAQEDWAIAVEISKYDRGSIETGKKGSRLPVLIRIATTLDVTTADLVTGNTRHKKSIHEKKLSALIDDCSEREYQTIYNLLEMMKCVLYENRHR